MFGYVAGQKGMGMDSVVIAPANAGFFALGLALLQGIIPEDKIPEDFRPRSIIYVAPPFRHTHYDGKQSSFTIDCPTCTKSFPTTSIRAQAQRRASMACCSP
jgi:hypothetical protein